MPTFIDESGTASFYRDAEKFGPINWAPLAAVAALLLDACRHEDGRERLRACLHRAVPLEQQRPA